MAQYCRYCLHLHVNNYPYCDKKDKKMAESSCKKPNSCKDFVFVDCELEYQDAFMENEKGYKPREKKEKQEEQIQGQLSFTDIGE